MMGKRYHIEALALTMRKMLVELEGWVAACIAEEEGEGLSETDTQRSALNLVITDGSQLVAIRYASPAPREPPSLYVSTTAGATLNRLYEGNPDKGNPILRGRPLYEGTRPKKDHGRHVIVASEPSTYDRSEWKLIPAKSMVIVGDDYVPVVVPL
jgi:glutamine amidotransferase